MEALADKFIAACAGDDLEGLAKILHPDVRSWATVGDELLGHGEGRDHIAVRSLFFLGPQRGWSLAPLPLEDGMALLATRNGEPVAVLRMDVRDDLIHSLHTVLLPAGLTPVVGDPP
jgi:RNA polymerase sigma-70 factor (ECF subfamily)